MATTLQSNDSIRSHMMYSVQSFPPLPLSVEVADDIMAAVVKAEKAQLKNILALEVSSNETLRYFQEQVGQSLCAILCQFFSEQWAVSDYIFR